MERVTSVVECWQLYLTGITYTRSVGPTNFALPWLAIPAPAELVFDWDFNNILFTRAHVLIS